MDGWIVNLKQECCMSECRVIFMQKDKVGIHGTGNFFFFFFFFFFFSVKLTNIIRMKVQSVP